LRKPVAHLLEVDPAFAAIVAASPPFEVHGRRQGDYFNALVRGPTVTGLLDGLEAGGYLSRERDPDDRRRLLVSLTAAGRELADRFRPAVHAAERPWLECLSEPERKSLLRLLGKVQAHLLPAQ